MVKYRTRTKTKVVYRKKRRKTTKGSTGGFLSNLGKPVGAMAYGAVREKVSDMIAQSKIGQSVPMTQFTDEVLMLAAMWGIGKTGIAKKGLARSIINNGKSVEYARIGQTLTDMYFKGGTVKTNNMIGGW